MAEQSPRVTVITFPEVSPENITQTPFCSICFASSSQIQNIQVAAAAGSLRSPCPPQVYFHHDPLPQTSLSVRQELPLDVPPTTETILRTDDVRDEMSQISTATPAEEDALSIPINNLVEESSDSISPPSQQFEYTRCQWSLIGLSLFLAGSGLLLFLFLLGFAYFGHSNWLTSKVDTSTIALIGTTSLLPAAYFSRRIHKYFLRPLELVQR